MKLPTNKYRVSPKEDRTLNGVVYASKAEMQYAERLALDPDVVWFLRQPPVDLTPDDRYRPDFLVHVLTQHSATGSMYVGKIYAVDVKGVETRDFKRIKRLWTKYGPFPLHIIKRGKTVEVLTGVQERT